MKFWIVSIDDSCVILNARDREFAKLKAFHFLGGNPDNYTVAPITDGPCKVYFYIATESRS